MKRCPRGCSCLSLCFCVWGEAGDVCDLETLGTVQGVVVSPETPLGEGSWNSVFTELTTVRRTVFPWW